MRAEEVSTALDLRPRFQWSVGDPRFESDTLKDHTYWSWEVPHDDSANLAKALATSVCELRAHAKFLREFVASGGEIEYFVGWFTTDVSGGETLSWELLRQLAELQIDLAFDVYGNK
jgi:hypothetical protein